MQFLGLIKYDVYDEYFAGKFVEDNNSLSNSLSQFLCFSRLVLKIVLLQEKISVR